MPELTDVNTGFGELSHEPTTGGQAQRQLARQKAFLVARYRLAAVSGRPEELIRPGTSRGVSLGYGCKTIRVRLMEGRDWVSEHDYQIKEGWEARLEEQCTTWFMEVEHEGTPPVQPQLIPRDKLPKP